MRTSKATLIIITTLMITISLACARTQSTNQIPATTPTLAPSVTNETRPTITQSATTTPPPTALTPLTAVDPYDDLTWPVQWVSIDPPEGINGAELTVVLKVPPSSVNELTYSSEVLYRPGQFGKFPTVVADKDGYAELRLVLHYRTAPPPGSHWPGELELTNTKIDGTKIVLKHPYDTQ